MALSSDEIRKLRMELEAASGANIKLQTSIKGLAEQYADIYKLNKQISDVKSKQAKGLNEINRLETEKIRLSRINTQQARDELDKLEDELKLRKQILKENNKKITQYEKELQILDKQSKSLANIASAIKGSLTPKIKELWKGFDEMDKAARTTAVQMGLTGKNVDKYRRSLDRIAYSTANIGVSYTELAKMQSKYVEQTGRAAILNDKSILGMAQMSKVLGISAEEAGGLVGDFQLLNSSTEAVVDLIQDTMDRSSKMGLNGKKVVDVMTKNLKIAQKYNFQDGLKNLEAMAANTVKFKLEMSNVASMAEKLFEPEGAIEMAANLQVLGGGFAALADPFKLMFMARNDMEALQESIIASTKGIVDFNSESGELNISAQELHRLKYAAQAAGLDLDNLIESARAAKQIDLVKKDIGFNIDPMYEDFITSTAKWNQDKKGWVITVVDEYGVKTEKLVKDLDAATLKAAYNENEALKKRAEQSQTFNDFLENLWMKLKIALLPALQGFADAMRGPVKKLIEKLSDPKVIEKLSNLMTGIFKLTDWIIDKINLLGDNVGAAIGAGIALIGAGAFGIGATIGAGFLSVAQGFMFGGGKSMIPSGGGGGTMLPGGGTKPGGVGGGKVWTLNGKQINVQGKIPKGAKLMPANQVSGATTKPGGVSGIGGGLFAAGFSGFNEWSQNSAMGMSQGENMMRTGMRGGLAGAGWIGGATLATKIAGKVAGPYGAIASLLLPMVGSMVGDYLGNKGGDIVYGQPMDYANDFISRPDGTLTKINSQDSLIGAKPGGVIDKMLTGTEVGGNTVVEFKPLKIEFSPIELKLNGSTLTINDFEGNPELVRALMVMIQENIKMAISGGKLAPASA